MDVEAQADLGAPATRSDLVRAFLASRTASVQLYVALVNSHIGDEKDYRAALNAFRKADEDLEALMKEWLGVSEEHGS